MKVDIFEKVKRLDRELKHYKKQASEWQSKYYKVVRELERLKKSL